MKLSGIAFRGHRVRLRDPVDEFDIDPGLVRAPLEDGYVPFDEYTGVIGRNDTGKTQLLRIVEDALDPTDDAGQTLSSSMLFFSCSEEELEALTQQATLDLTTFEDEPFSLEENPVEADRERMWDSRPSLDYGKLEEARLSKDEPAIDQYAEALREAWRRDEASFTRLLGSATTPASDLGQSWPLTVALRRSGNCWGLYWCVPPADRCAESLRLDLGACLLGPGISGKEAGEDTGERMQFQSDPSTFSWPTEAPVPVAPVGVVPLPLTPRSLRATDLRSVIRGLEWTFGEFAVRTRRLEALLNFDFEVLGDENHIPGYGLSPAATREALSKVWLKPTPTGGYEVNPDILLQTKQLEILANELLPSFISDYYQLVISISPPTLWDQGPRLRLSLGNRRGVPAQRETLDFSGKEVELETRRFGPEFWPEHRFPADRVAQGFQLWIGIALTEASNIFTIVASQLDHFSEDLVDARAFGDEDEDRSVEAAEAALRAAREIADTMEEAMDGESMYGPLDEFLKWVRINPLIRARAEQQRGLIYLLDEPERHLHPALQREAAEWLQKRLESSGFQAVVVTHSLPFMSVSGNASFTYLVREPEAPTVLLPIKPRELDSLSLAAAELGIDRGELLSLVNLFLWVEGYSEQVILETLFGPELRELGVKVIPLHGHPGARGILDSRIHSFTSARAAVWLDAISPEFVAEAEANPEVKTDSPEKKTLAQVIRSARESEIPIVPISVRYPGDDVFDLLDDLAIESEYPNYPGHEEARRLWAEAREKGAKVGSRKDFWARKFKTPITPESCQIIAARMRREGRATPQLASVLEQCRAIVEG